MTEPRIHALSERLTSDQIRVLAEAWEILESLTPETVAIRSTIPPHGPVPDAIVNQIRAAELSDEERSEMLTWASIVVTS